MSLKYITLEELPGHRAAKIATNVKESSLSNRVRILFKFLFVSALAGSMTWLIVEVLSLPMWSSVLVWFFLFSQIINLLSRHKKMGTVYEIVGSEDEFYLVVEDVFLIVFLNGSDVVAMHKGTNLAVSVAKRSEIIRKRVTHQKWIEIRDG